VAVNGEEALTLWRKGNFDLILMDVQMPVLDGLMATRLIREEESGGNKHVPIIALTAYGSEQSERPCLEAGMDGFVTKPVRADELARIISQVSKH
jgi:CheY-like chemotaxis protein